MLPSLIRYVCRRRMVLSVMAACALLLGCGGGGGVGEGGTGGGKIFGVGRVTALTETTVTVGDIDYDRSTAQVIDGFNQPIDASRLALGAWVDVSGITNDGGRTGRAQTLRLHTAARGVVESVDAGNNQFTVLGSTVDVGGSTVLDGVAQASSLKPGDTVEVYGALSLEDDRVDASRVEKLGPSGSGQVMSSLAYELRGVVSQLNLSAQTMRVGKQLVVYDHAQVLLNASLAAGRVVRVAANAPPTSGQAWSVARVVDDQVLTGQVAWAYAEGVVSQWASGVSGGPVFNLDGLSVDASNAERRVTVTGNGLRVAVIGSLESGVLKATAVRVVEPGEPVVFWLSGAIKKFSGIDDFRINGTPVDASQARLIGGTAQDLANGRKVRVKGRVKGQVLMATTVEFIP